MINKEVKRYNPNEEYYTDEACYINELSNTNEDPHLSIARARVESGKTTKWHRLEGITERYVILEGIGRVEIGNLSPTDVTPGDVVVIPPMTRQRIINTGPEDLIFLAICTPRFLEQAYQEIECG
jgi:mannose-6-phosphate isomerase-like protein (cupin superfamily)